MKKLISLVVLVAIVASFLVLGSKQEDGITPSPVAQGSTLTESSSLTTQPGLPKTAPSDSNSEPGDAPLAGELQTDQTQTVEEVRPATEAYASAEEALAAVLNGSKDYNDSILEQFTLPGADCSWCAEFYTSVREKATNPATSQEQRAYLAEILAISGRPENIETLVESIKMARSNEEADLYAEAIELALGDVEITKYLANQMVSPNDTLREASVAAITNQGTLTAVELLSKHVEERGDPDGYYASGIGPAELIPDEEALPYVQELIERRDAYSHLWVKSAMNAGIPGLRIVFDELENSPNPANDGALLKDAIDHINLEDGLMELTSQVIARNKSEEAVKLAKKIQEEFNQQENEGAQSIAQ